MDSKKSSKHLEEFDLKDITTHFGRISDLLGFDQLEHAVQVSVLQARMMRALKELRIKNNELRDGGFDTKEASSRIFWSGDRDVISEIDNGETAFMEDLVSYLIAAGIRIDEIRFSSAVDPSIKVTVAVDGEMTTEGF